MEENINYSFSNKYFLERALTRKAYALEQKQQNKECDDQEIYRTLGDAILKAVLVELLINAGCKTREEITNKKKDLEREEMLAKLARQFNVGDSVKLGVGERRQRAEKEPKVLAETLEALIGAIYLDGGYNVSREVITRWFKDLL